MTFDGAAAARNQGYYDTYEAEFGANLDRIDALSAQLWAPAPNDTLVTLEGIGEEIDTITRAVCGDRIGSLAVLPFSYRLAREQTVRDEELGADSPFKAIELKAYRQLKLGNNAKLIGAHVSAKLVGFNSPSIGWHLRFGEQAMVNGASAHNLKLPKPKDTPLAIHKVLRALHP